MNEDEEHTGADAGETHAYNLNSWMSDLHSSIKHLRISDLSLPSAHNSGFDVEGNPNDFFDTCQDKSFRHQLDNGVRVLDIRLRWFSGYGPENINRGLMFYHSRTSVRTFANMLNDVDRFQEANPDEIVFLDFHLFEAQREDEPVPYALIHAHFMRHYTSKMLPFSARDLNLDEIRAQYSGPRIIVAAPSVFWNDGTGGEIPVRDRSYFWDQIDHEWVGGGEVSVDRLKSFMNEVMRNPPSGDYPWSMSATAYNFIEGPVNLVETLASWYPTDGEWQRKSSIINFDWCTRSNSILIRQCIESNSLKPARSLPLPIVLSPVEGDVLPTFRPIVSGKGVPGATVYFYWSGRWDNTYGQAEVGTDGVWTDRFSRDLPDATFELSCNQLLNSARSKYSLPVTFTVGLSAPVIRTPINGDEFESFRPTISGEGTPGATVHFFESGFGTVLYGQAEVGDDGKWIGSFTVDVPVSSFSIVCNQTLNGLESDYSLPVTFTVVLSTPAIRSPINGAAVYTLRPTIRGLGEPGAIVRFFQKDVGIGLFGTALVDIEGRWCGTFTMDVPQSPFSFECDQVREDFRSKCSRPLTFTLRVARQCYLHVSREFTGESGQANSQEKR